MFRNPKAWAYFWLLLSAGCSGGSPSSAAPDAAGGQSGMGGTSSSGGQAGAPSSGGQAGSPLVDVGIISASAASQREAESTLAVSSDGRVAVAWIGGSEEDGRIGFTISSDDGATWPEPSGIAPPLGGSAADPVLAADGAGNIYLAFLEFQVDNTGLTHDTHIWVAKSAPGQAGFSTPVEASQPENPAVADKPWITTNAKNQVIVAYQLQTGLYGKTTALVSARSDDGASFTRTEIIAEGTAVHHMPALCTDPKSDRLWVSYIWYSGSVTSTRHVDLRRSDDGGASWPAEATEVNLLEETDVAFDDPTCVANGDDVWVSYGLTKDVPSGEDFGTAYALRLAHSSDAGASISARYDIGESAGLFLHPALALDGTLLHVAYYAGAYDGDPAGSVRRRFASSADAAFGPSRVIHQPITFLGSRTSERWIGEYFGFAARNSRLYSAYLDNAGTASHVAFRREPAE